MARAGMGGPTLDLDLEASDALARRDATPAVTRGLGHERDRGLPAMCLDEVAARRRADLLVGREQEDERTRRSPALRRSHEGPEGQIGAALHVVDAWAVELVAFAPE